MALSILSFLVGLTALSPNDFRIALRFDPAMSVHQPMGLSIVVVPLETFSENSLKTPELRVTFSVFSETASIVAKGISRRSKGYTHLL